MGGWGIRRASFPHGLLVMSAVERSPNRAPKMAYSQEQAEERLKTKKEKKRQK